MTAQQIGAVLYTMAHAEPYANGAPGPILVEDIVERTGMTQEIWWAALAATLREALADRQRIEALETATIRTCTPPNSLGVQLDHWPDRDPERSISIAGTPIGINSGATLREAIDKLREDE